MVKYLVNWIAGNEAHFLLCLFGDAFCYMVDDNISHPHRDLQWRWQFSSFYWRLFPMMREMDETGNIQPNGYSKTLGVMIGVFIMVF